MCYVGLPVRTTLLQNATLRAPLRSMLDYQSERHCSKTRLVAWHHHTRWITSQNDTAPKLMMFYYSTKTSWITSQNDTAPKRVLDDSLRTHRWITSQNDTAPKLGPPPPQRAPCWITSQNDTAPKRYVNDPTAFIGWITSQNDTAPKRSWRLPVSPSQLDYQSERHCSKTIGTKSSLHRR